MILVLCKQGTPEWFATRAGVITASNFSTACEFLKPSKKDAVALPSQKNIDYAYRVAVERIYGQTTEDTYQTFEMRRGTELEPFARMAYEENTGNLAEESGIVLTEDSLFGYSTDGFVGNDGMIEIKCPNSARKIVEMWATGDTSEYAHQIQGGLWLTGRSWCDFVMYAPQLESIGKQLFIKRVKRDESFIEDMEEKLWNFAKRVQAHVETLTKKAA